MLSEPQQVTVPSAWVAQVWIWPAASWVMSQRHWPATHDSPVAGQALPQAPQFFGSVCRFEQ
jgi:hypothetical protein